MITGIDRHRNVKGKIVTFINLIVLKIHVTVRHFIFVCMLISRLF